ncbi:hypothetical protein N7G274_002320 [Stereocaulon virgatum]|uniref:Uncharacterized protein n=1 Tax=Stereocaulon virgatum TaxID=373712 RepID=A0ABR4AHI1_9LECA
MKHHVEHRGLKGVEHCALRNVIQQNNMYHRVTKATGLHHDSQLCKGPARSVALKWKCHGKALACVMERHSMSANVSGSFSYLESLHTFDTFLLLSKRYATTRIVGFPSENPVYSLYPATQNMLMKVNEPRDDP